MSNCQRRKTNAPLMEALTTIENTSNETEIINLEQQIISVLDSYTQISDFEYVFTDRYSAITNLLQNDSPIIIANAIIILERVCNLGSFKEEGELSSGQSLTRFMTLFAEAFSSVENPYSEIREKFETILISIANGYKVMLEDEIKDIINKLLDSFVFPGFDVIYSIISQNNFKKETFNEKMIIIFNKCNKAIHSDDVFTVTWALRCVETILSKDFTDFRIDDFYNSIVEIIGKCDNESDIQIIAYSISLLKYLKIDEEGLIQVAKYLHHPEPQIIQKSLEVLNYYNENLNDSDELRNIFIEAFPKLLENSLYIKSMSLNILTIVLNDVEKLTYDSIDDLIDLVPEAKDLNLLMENLYNICCSIEKIGELENGYSFDSFIEHISDFESDITEYSIDEEISEENREYASLLLTKISDYINNN